MDLSLGNAKPILAAINRCASLVEFSLMTVKATCPGLMCFNPSLREINLQLGGNMEETRTMLHAAIPALRKANSKLESLSRCLPTPLVRNIFFATNAMGRFFVPPCVVCRGKPLRKSNKKVLHCQCVSAPFACGAEHDRRVTPANLLHCFDGQPRQQFPERFARR